MADTNTANVANAKYSFSANTITPQDYDTIVKEREELVKKQLDANNEFMFQHYNRLLRDMDVSYERATKANVAFQRKSRREEAKKRREALRPRK